jgi:hypothetical protein
MCIKARRGDARVLLLLSIGSGLAISDAANGRITLSLSAEQTSLPSARARGSGVSSGSTAGAAWRSPPAR